MTIFEQQIQDYLHYCEFTRGMTWQSIYSKRSSLTLFARVTKLDKIENLTNVHFDLWCENRKKKGLRPSSINAHNSRIIALIRYYRELGTVIPINLMLVRDQKASGSKKPRVWYSIEEVERVLAIAGEDAHLMIKVCVDTGMRLTELKNLRLSQITGKRVNFVGKGNKAREVYLSSSTKRELDGYVERHGITDYLWLNVLGRHMSRDSVRRIMAEPFIALGHDDFHPHALRHTFATDKQRQGASTEEIQHMLGHSSVKTTEHYLHAFEGQLRATFEKYEHSYERRMAVRKVLDCFKKQR